MWVAVTSIGFGAAIGVNVVALWLTDRFGQLQRANEELSESGGLIERGTSGRSYSVRHGAQATVQFSLVGFPPLLCEVTIIN